MRQLVQSILATEAEAKAMVAAAAREAERIVADARTKSREDSERALHDAHAEAARIREAVRVATAAEKAAQLAQVTAGIENRVRLDATWREDAIAAVVRCVCGQSSQTRNTHAYARTDGQ
jgi:vacuolar-type H+-ATPase subunit H